mmetsp:Transcript_71903/g.168287  ORF Transcript_71903/g.168287 Transcript_71903/m.168287 type:complete len:208 (-) Transcript_71903:1069-1692(-)
MCWILGSPVGVTPRSPETSFCTVVWCGCEDGYAPPGKYVPPSALWGWSEKRFQIGLARLAQPGVSRCKTVSRSDWVTFKGSMPGTRLAEEVGPTRNGSFGTGGADSPLAEKMPSALSAEVVSNERPAKGNGRCIAQCCGWPRALADSMFTWSAGITSLTSCLVEIPADSDWPALPDVPSCTSVLSKRFCSRVTALAPAKSSSRWVHK